MIGRLEAQQNLFYRFRIKDHVPQDRHLRQIDWLLEFHAIRAELTNLYCQARSVGPQRAFHLWPDGKPR